MIKPKIQKAYITARRVTEVNFPRLPCCIDCLYFRQKSGLNKDSSERYQFYMCQLTYEPLTNIANSIGKFCPLEFSSSDELTSKSEENG